MLFTGSGLALFKKKFFCDKIKEQSFFIRIFFLLILHQCLSTKNAAALKEKQIFCH